MLDFSIISFCSICKRWHLSKNFCILLTSSRPVFHSGNEEFGRGIKDVEKGKIES